MKNQLNIVEFYRDKEIFITGGLGFMGKVLIEKLLRSCPGIQKIYVLIRESPGKTARNRLTDSLDCPLFDLLRSQSPQALHKLIPVPGDVTVDGLGISKNDILQMENVSIVFHSAATTRFKEVLSKSIMINTNGAYQVLRFAEKLKHIKVVLHLSTAFCNLDQEVLEEKIYPPYENWKLMIDLAKNSKDDILNQIFHKYAKINHNTYTFSKHLAEQVVANYRDILPIVLFRPSVVINTICEPVAGWTDTLSGPLALAVGVGTGLIRMSYVNSRAEPEMIPVDLAIKVIIVAACKKGMETERSKAQTTQLTVYNCSKRFDSAYMSKVAADVIRDNPFEKCIWNPSSSSTNCRVYFLINFMLFQILPAIFIDAILFVVGRKPFFLKLQRKVYNGIMAYYPFHSEYFRFSCERTIALDSEIQPSEFEAFAFLHYSYADVRKTVVDSIKGLKLYYFKEPRESTQKARNLSIFLIVLDRVVKVLFFGFILNWIFQTEMIQGIFN